MKMVFGDRNSVWVVCYFVRWITTDIHKHVVPRSPIYALLLFLFQLFVSCSTAGYRKGETGATYPFAFYIMQALLLLRISGTLEE